MYMLEVSYTTGNTNVLKIVPDWSQIKISLAIIFVSVTLSMSLLCFILIRIFSKKRVEAKMKLLNKNLLELMQNPNYQYSEEFKEIEMNVMQTKNELVHHQQLLQIETQRKNDLITYLAHDLKTPLASVIGYLSLLDESTTLPKPYRLKYTRIALDKAYRLEELINQFFDVTRFNLQSLVIQKTKIKLNFMLEQLKDEFTVLLDGRTLSIQCPEDLMLQADGDKLARVLNNILRNAITYSDSSSLITLEAKKEDKHCLISVTNTGSSIPPYELEHIFEKFFRLDQARSSSTGQSGLGLAIAHDIILAHQGEIHAFSEENTTQFVITLPI